MQSESFGGIGLPGSKPRSSENGQDRSSRPRVVMPSLTEEPVAAVAPEPREAPMVRPRTQVGLGPGAVDVGNELVTAATSQSTSTVRETPDARADDRSAEGKVIRFPAPRREDEAPLEPAPPDTAPLVPMAQVPIATVPLATVPQSEVKPTVREPLAGRTPNEGVRPAVVYGPSETVRLPPPAPVVAASPQPAGSSTMSSSHHDPSAPVSPRDVTPSRGSLSRSSEDLFFKEGEEGRYEGGPSSIPPTQTLSAADPLHDPLHGPVPVQRTPEQEERRARFIRWVVLAMGFGIAISTMGIVLRKVAPPAATGDAPLAAPPAMPLPEPLPPVEATRPSVPPPAVVPPPPALPVPAPEVTAAPPPPVAEKPKAPEPVVAPPPVEKPVVAKPPVGATPPVVAPPVAPKPPASAKPPAPVAAAPKAPAEPKAPAAPKAPKPEAAPAPPPPAPPPPAATASFPVD